MGLGRIKHYGCMGMRGTDEILMRRGLALGLRCCLLRSSPHSGCEPATVMSTGADVGSREHSALTPDPRAQAVLHCEGRVRSSVRDVRIFMLE